MEPVEIDIRMKQNVTEEGKKATGAMGEMDEAAKKMQEQVESMLEQRKKLIADIEKNLSKTATNISHTSDTLSGDVSKLKKASDILGESLESAKKEVSDVEAVLQSGTATIEDFSSASEQLNQVGGELADILTKSNDLQDISNDLMNLGKGNVEKLTRSKLFLAKANEWVAKTFKMSEVAAKRFTAVASFGLTIAISALIGLYERYKTKQEEINRLKKEFADIEKGAIKGMADEKVTAEQLMRVAGDHTKNLDLRKQAVEKLNKLMPDYNGYINREGQLIGNADTALKNYLVSLYKVEKAKKLIAGIEEDTANIDNLKSTGSDPVTFLERMGLGAAKLLTPTNYDEISNKFFQNKSKKWINQISGIEAGKKQKEDELQKLLGDKNVFTSVFGSPDKSSGGSSSSTPSTKEEYNAQAELADRLTELRKRTTALEIDIMQEGLQKKLAQIDNEEEEELARIKAQQKKILDIYNKENKTDIKDIKSIPGIDPETLAGIEAERTKIMEAAEAKRKQATEANAKEITDLARKYASEEVNIRYDYQQDIDKLEKAGNTEAANAARMERDKRISELSSSLIEETKLFKLATDDKLRLTKELNDRLIQLAKERIKNDPTISQEDKNKLLSAIDQAGAERTGRTILSVTDSINKLIDAKRKLKGKIEVGDVVGAAEAQKEIDGLTKSFEEKGHEILQYFNMISDGVITVMDQLGMLTEEEKQTANEVMGAVSGAGQLALGIATGNPIDIITGAVGLLTNAIALFDVKSKKIAKQQKEHKKNLDDLAHAYTNLQREVDKALGTDVYKKQKEAIANLRKQIAENERLIALEQQKKKKKQNQEDIAAWRAEIDALKGEIDDTIQSITEDLAQTNARDLARTLADALVSAARTGEDAFTAMGDVINDVLRNAVVNALSKRFLEKQMDEATEYLAGAMGDGDLSDYEKRRFEEMIRNAGTAFNTALSAYDELFANQDDAARRSASKGIAQASQDSIDELSGTITFMAGEFRTANVLAAARTETGKDMLLITRTILSVLNVIAENTSYNKRLEDIAEGIEKLNRDGVLMKR